MKTTNLLLAIIIPVMMSLTSCRKDGDSGGDSAVIEKESFIPAGLPEISDYESYSFCFTTDSCGLCVSNMPPRGKKGYRYIVSATYDGGHRWKKLGTGKGECRWIRKSGDHIYLECILHGNQDTTVILRSPATKKFCPKAILKTRGSINSFHAFDEKTFVYFRQREKNKGAYRFTTDSGKNWKTEDVPGIMLGSEVKYSGDKMFIPLMGGIYIKDIRSGKELFFKKKGFISPIVSGQWISFSGKDLWKYDGKHIDQIHDFITGEMGLLDGFFAAEGDLLIGKGVCRKENRESKKFTEENCLLYSVDGGYTWDSFDKSPQNIKSISSIPVEDGIGVICSKSDGNELNIIRIRKAQKLERSGKKRPHKRLKPTKEIPDSLTEKDFFNFVFGDLVEFYEEKIWGKTFEKVIKN